MRFSSLRAGTALLLALLAVAAGAAVYVYHARTPDLALQVSLRNRMFAPAAGAGGERSPIHYFVRYSDPHATVEIVGRNKRLVRTIQRDAPLQAGERMTYRWDGLDDDGELAEPGRYRLRVILPGQDRDMVFPRRITVEPRAFAPTSRDGGNGATGAGGGSS